MAIPQTHRVHCVQACGKDEVKVADISDEIETSFRLCRIHSSNVTPQISLTTEQGSPIDDSQRQLPTLNLTTGQWVIVKYDGEEFPGEVTGIDKSDVQVNVMHRSGNAWKWPRSEDKIFYPRNILCIVNPPTVADSLYFKTFSILCF